MNGHFLCGVLLVVVSMTTISQGDRIALSATPTTFTPGKTPELTVRCGLEDDGQSNLIRVNSIIIGTVDGSVQKEVARIVRGQAATGGFSTTGANVTGDVCSKKRYLQVTWPSPRHGLAGLYICDILALAPIEDTITFNSSIVVVSTGKTAASSVSTQCQCTEDIEALKKAVGDSQREFDSLRNTVNDLKTNVSGLSSVHNEEGNVLCYDSDSWGAKMKERERVVDVRFSTPYTRNPQVFIAAVSLDAEKTRNLRYRIGIRDLTPTGFKVVCSTWWDAIMHRIDVRWISVVA